VSFALFRPLAAAVASLIVARRRAAVPRNVKYYLTNYLIIISVVMFGVL
jgi:hypothetical protein